jgi:hypothetical protein
VEHGSAHPNIEMESDFFVLQEIKEAEHAAIVDEPASKFLFLKLYKKS